MEVGVRAVLLVVVMVCAHAAQAQSSPVTVRDEGQPSGAEDAAKGLFAAGKAEYDAGQYDKALQHFQEAYLQSRRPQLLYNVGLAADRLRYNRTALEAFERYLKELPDAENRVEVQNRIRALRAVTDREGHTAPGVAASAAAPRSPTALEQSLSPKPAGQQEHEQRSIASRWWFWTAVGVVVAGATTGIVLASGGTRTGKPTPGSDGVVVLTLRRQ